MGLADRPTGIVAAKYDVTIQIPAYNAPGGGGGGTWVFRGVHMFVIKI